MHEQHYKQILRFKKLKRMFGRIKKFRINFSIAKTKLKHTLERTNKRKLLLKFKFWVNLIK